MTRRHARIANVVVWLGAWLAIGGYFGALSDPARLAGEAVIPAVLCFGIDRALRRRTSRATPRPPI